MANLFDMRFTQEQREQLAAALVFSFPDQANSNRLSAFYGMFGQFQLVDGRVETKKNKVWKHSLVFDNGSWFLRGDDGSLVSMDSVHPSIQKVAVSASEVVGDFLQTMGIT